MDKGEMPLNIFLDLTKAFNAVGHKVLLHKLEFYGISDKVVNILESYLVKLTENNM